MHYIRLLGVNIEENLAWNSHIISGEKAILPACRKQLGSLRYISQQIPKKSRLVLANSLIISRILYAIALWGGTYPTNLKKIQSLMNKTAHWVTNANRKSKTKELMISCNWLGISDLVQLHSLIAFWKILWLKISFQLHRKVQFKEDFTIVTQKPRLQTVQLGYLW